MLQPDIMNVAFASSGQKTYPIPSGTSFGNASLTAGFPPETSNPLLDGGVPPKRTDFNGILYWLSAFAMFQQSGGKFTFSTEINYDVPSIIYYNGDLWWCLRSNGPTNGGIVTPGTNANYWKKFKEYISSPLDAYPIGAYYISSSPTSPATLFGGTWVQVKDRMILAVGDTYNSAGLTGGSATTKLVVNNIPSHNHSCGTTGNHSHTATTSTAGNHSHTRGSMNITGGFSGVGERYNGIPNTVSGAFYVANTSSNPTQGAKVGNGGDRDDYFGFDASRSWTGSTSTAGNHTHTLTTSTNGNHNHTIGNTGSGTAFNTISPYITAYVWRRTA